MNRRQAATWLIMVLVAVIIAFFRVEYAIAIGLALLPTFLASSGVLDSKDDKKALGERIQRDDINRQLDMVYGPLVGAIGEFKAKLVDTDYSQFTVGFPIEATVESRRMQEVFSNYPHLVKNDKILHGWRQVEKCIQRHGQGLRMDIWVNREIFEWFNEVEAEYNKLRKSLD